MAKPNGNRSKWILVIIGILVTVALAALGSMNAMGVFQGEIKRDVVHNHEAIQGVRTEVQEELRPAIAKINISQAECRRDIKGINEDITELESDVDALGGKIDTLRTDQNANFQKILERLPK